MNTLDTQIHSLLEASEPFVLVTVVNQDGSAPRGAGSRMIVRKDATIAGTIGGGRVEAESIKAAVETLASGTPRVIRYDLSKADKTNMDMICGGRMDILFEPMHGAPEQRDMFAAAAGPYLTRRGAFFLVLLQPIDGEAPQYSRALVQPTPPGKIDLFRENGPAARVVGAWTPPAPLLDQLLARAKGRTTPLLVEEDGRKILIEPCACPGTAYIFGAGHISLEVAALAKRVGFRVAVLDDRAEFANRDRFPEADLVIVPPSMEKVWSLPELKEETPDEDSYIVIVTRGHRHDKTLLGQALHTRAGYIGMIGSRTKQKLTYKSLMDEEGFRREEFERVHNPIGLQIGAQTPEEIAVSIVAELIQARAARAGE